MYQLSRHSLILISFSKLSLLLLPFLAMEASPKDIPLYLVHSTRSDVCPHGVHYIDQCKNACSCDPRYGGAMCTRMADCEDSKGNCPFGETFTDPLWGSNFQCKCNNDKSQTYECFDLSVQKNVVYSLYSSTEGQG